MFLNYALLYNVVFLVTMFKTIKVKELACLGALDLLNRLFVVCKERCKII